MHCRIFFYYLPGIPANTTHTVKVAVNFHLRTSYWKAYIKKRNLNNSKEGFSTKENKPAEQTP